LPIGTLLGQMELILPIVDQTELILLIRTHFAQGTKGTHFTHLNSLGPFLPIGTQLVQWVI